MTRWRRLLFGAALLAFGVASAGAVRPLAAQADECPGTNGLFCGSVKTSVCTNVTICGIRLSFPFALILCCGKTTTTTDYYYYPADF